MVMNRPGYQQLFQEKFIRQRETERQTQLERLPGQDKDYQPQYAMPVQYEQGNGDNQLNFELDTDQHDMLNFMPDRNLDN